MDRFAVIEAEIETIENIYGYNGSESDVDLQSQDDTLEEEQEVHAETDDSSDLVSDFPPTLYIHYSDLMKIKISILLIYLFMRNSES